MIYAHLHFWVVCVIFILYYSLKAYNFTHTYQLECGWDCPCE